MRIKKLTCVCFVLIISITFFMQLVSANQIDEVSFSLTVWDQPLKSVIKHIERQTGYNIILKGPINSEPISGVYNNITLSNFMAIALKENDISIETETNKKSITISKIDARNMAGQGGSVQEIDDFLASEAEYIIQAKESTKNLSYEERQQLHTDSLTGRTWHEVEQGIQVAGKNKGQTDNMGEAEFLVSESDYIQKAIKRAKIMSNKSADLESIDSLSGKSWRKIEAAMQ